MRLIGGFDNEKQAHHFSCFLLKEGIENTYEKGSFRIWVEEEDDAERASGWLEKFKENPNDPIFSDISLSPKVIATEAKKHLAFKVKVEMGSFRFSFTHFIIILCTFLFIWNQMEEISIKEYYGPVGEELTLTPLEQELLFDYPENMQKLDALVKSESVRDYKSIQDMPLGEKTLFAKAESTPTWKGFYHYYNSPNKSEIHLFEKIREGEVWRLFTPCLLHGNFLHILFNMAWVLILGKMIGQRVLLWRYLFLIFVSAILSNVAQYFVGGPFFLGYSGVVVAMAGFIWVRQKVAPWEGYPLQKSTAVFLLLFVCAMFALEVGSFFLTVFKVTTLSAQIANTAHVVGGLVGMLIARIPFLSRSGK